MRAAHSTQPMQTQQDKERSRTYTGLVLIGAVAVLWIGVVLLMAEVHKNARPVFIVLGGVITVGLGYAWYDFNWKRENEKTGAEQMPLMHPVYDEKNQPVAFAPGHVPPGYPPYYPYFPRHHPQPEIETHEMKELKSQIMVFFIQEKMFILPQLLQGTHLE